jgi:peroxiredoxin Q/BCP
MYGRTFWGIERSTFLIDPKGRLKAIFRKVKVDGHAEEVLNALK